MKRILFLIGILISTYSFGQTIVFKSDSAAYEMTDSSLKATQFNIHATAQGWIVETFKDSKEVVKLDDMDSGELTGLGTVRLSGRNEQFCSFIFAISSRENNYKCKIFNIEIVSPDGVSRKSYQFYLNGGKKQRKMANSIDASIRYLMSDLYKTMKIPTED